MGSMQGASRFRLAILDTSRTRTPGSVAGLDLESKDLESKDFPPQVCRVEPQGETLVAYSTQEGKPAHDGDGRNSPYTQALLHYLEYPHLDIGLLFRRVRDAVVVSTMGYQEPVVYGSSGQGVYPFVPPGQFEAFEVLDQAGE